MRSRIYIPFAVAVAALGLAGTAWALTGASFNYSRAQTGFYSINPTAMSPDSDESAQDYSVDWDNGLSSQVAGCFNTGVNIPEGATLDSVTVWYRSSTGDQDPTFTLVRRTFHDQTVEKLIYGGPIYLHQGSVHFGVYEDKATVRNARYSYGFGVCLIDTEAFYGARVKYRYTKAGD